jgi:RNA-directed DNA polymerase
MSRWRPQLYKNEGLDKQISEEVLTHALAIAEAIVKPNPRLPPVFTLKHLAYLSDVNYGLLRIIVSRKNLNPYRIFRIRKRPSSLGEQRYRIIAVPEPGLLKAQQWIAQKILSQAKPHSASVAFSKGDKLFYAAAPHCQCRWLIKLDVRNFFESVSEIAVYRVFLSLGYQPLVSMELARLCTRLRSSDYGQGGRWGVRWWQWSAIKAYQVWRSDHGDRMGHLPQGAPTSPMLANLAMRDFDKLVSQITNELGLTYTRYADDLTLSTRSKDYTREECGQAIGKVYAAMALFGLSPNATKTKILSPGSRKVVLGLLVDGPKPKLLRDFKAMMRQHLYYLLHPAVGPVLHARARGFTSVIGLRNHLFGLASFAKQIEPAYGARVQNDLETVNWPL